METIFLTLLRPMLFMLIIMGLILMGIWFGVWRTAAFIGDTIAGANRGN